MTTSKTQSYNADKNDCKPPSYRSVLGSRIESVLESFGSHVQSHDQAMGVANCSPGTPLLLVFPMPRAKTKYQQNQEIALGNEERAIELDGYETVTAQSK